MTQHDKEELAELVAQRVQRHGCAMGWTAEDTATLRQFAAAVRLTLAAGCKALVVVVVGGVVALLVKGFEWRIEQVKERAPAPPPHAVTAAATPGQPGKGTP